MKKIVYCILAIFVTVSSFAKVTGSMPDWKWDSKVLLSEYVWYANKTVRDLFGTPKDGTSVKITAENDIAILEIALSRNGDIIITMDVVIRFSGKGKAMTCFVSRLDYEVPSTFQHESMKTSDPYSREGGQILGFLSQILPSMFEITKTELEDL
jgi:hypothetical protein